MYLASFAKDQICFDAIKLWKVPKKQAATERRKEYNREGLVNGNKKTSGVSESRVVCQDFKSLYSEPVRFTTEIVPLRQVQSAPPVHPTQSRSSSKPSMNKCFILPKDKTSPDLNNADSAVDHNNNIVEKKDNFKWFLPRKTNLTENGDSFHTESTNLQSPHTRDLYQLEERNLNGYTEKTKPVVLHQPKIFLEHTTAKDFQVKQHYHPPSNHRRYDSAPEKELRHFRNASRVSKQETVSSEITTLDVWRVICNRCFGKSDESVKLDSSLYNGHYNVVKRLTTRDRLRALASGRLIGDEDSTSEDGGSDTEDDSDDCSEDDLQEERHGEVSSLGGSSGGGGSATSCSDDADSNSYASSDYQNEVMEIEELNNYYNCGNEEDENNSMYSGGQSYRMSYGASFESFLSYSEDSTGNHYNNREWE